MWKKACSVLNFNFCVHLFCKQASADANTLLNSNIFFPTLLKLLFVCALYSRKYRMAGRQIKSTIVSIARNFSLRFIYQKLARSFSTRKNYFSSGVNCLSIVFFPLFRNWNKVKTDRRLFFLCHFYYYCFKTSAAPLICLKSFLPSLSFFYAKNNAKPSKKCKLFVGKS